MPTYETIEEMRYALRLKQMNEELLEYLSSSLWWLIHYSKKYGIELPEKEKILLAINRIREIADRIPSSSPEVKQSDRYPEDKAEPKVWKEC